MQLTALRESERVKTVSAIPKDECKALNALWMRSALETDEAMRIDGIDDDDFDALGTRLASTETELRKALARGNTDVILHALRGFLELAEFDLQTSPKTWRRLAYSFLQTVIPTFECQRKRHAGEIVDIEAVAPAASVYCVWSGASAGLDFDTAFELWNAWKMNRPPRAVRA